MKFKKHRLLFLVVLIGLIAVIMVPATYAAEEDAEDEGWLEILLSKTIGKTFEDAFNNSSSLISKWVFLTPRLINFDWIQKLWWNNYILAIIMSIVGMGITALMTFRGTRIPSGEIIKALVVALICSYFSLYITDQLIEGSNAMTNAMVRETLVTEYFREENKSAILQSDLDPEEIGFNSFTSKSLLKLAFGGDLTDEKAKMYQTFSRKRGGAGFLTMVWAMSINWLIGLFGYIRYGVLGLLGAGSPFWFSACSFTGNLSPAIGYINLYVRSLALSYIFDLAWLFSVYVNRASEFEGLGRQTITCIIFTIALVGAVWVWFIWVIKAVKQPFTLAGAEAQKHYGNMMQKAGGAFSTVGNRFGIESLKTKGGEMEVVGAEHVKISGDKVSGQFTGSSNDRLAQARQQYKLAALDRARREKIVKEFSMGPDEEEIEILQEISSLGISEIGLEKILQKEGLSESVIDVEDGKLLVNDSSVNRVEEVIKKAYKDKFMDDFDLAGSEGVLINKNINHINDVMDRIESKKLNPKDIYKISIAEEEIKALKTLVYDFKILAEKSIQRMPNGTAMINSEENSGVEKIFDIAGIDYNRVGNDIFFKESAYKQIEHEIESGKKFIDKFHLEDNNTFDFNIESKEQRESIIKDIKSTGLKYKQEDMLWLDNKTKDKFLDDITCIDESEDILEISDYAYIDLANKEFYNGVYEEIEKYMPYAIVPGNKKDEKNNRLIIERKHIKGVKDLIKKYSTKLPYWKDSKGNFYYYDTMLRMYVKDVEEPENGRYLGRYHG